MSKKDQSLGIIQSRGLGDIIIALPIARHYHSQGWKIYWPILEEFVPNFQQHVPWVNWIPIPYDPPGRYFYDIPLQRLKNLNCTEIMPLYQALTNHRFHEELYFQHTKFDQYKYIRAGVNFLEKWKLADCITRDTQAEAELKQRLVHSDNYAVVHLEGSDHQATFNEASIPKDWQIIYVTPGLTQSIFNWISVLEGAESIVCVDSCIANMVDQLGIGEDLYLIPRSHIGLTPVFAQPWQWVKF